MPLPPLPRRLSSAHKGSCGRVLIVGGSRGMAGAPCLAARAAVRSGAGLVQAAVPEGIWDLVATKLDEPLTAGLPQTPQGSFSRRALSPLRKLSHLTTVAVLGPGAGSLPQTADFLRQAACALNLPLLLDADGLNAWAGRLELLARARARRSSASPLILTPHPGEAARLLGTSTVRVQSDRSEAVRLLQRRLPGSVVVLKGAGTLVSDGRRIYRNRTGNPGLASGGTGDVLSGVIAALLGQGLSAFEAACLGVHLHGLAGDLAARKLGLWSLQAGDVIEALPLAFMRHARARSR